MPIDIEEDLYRMLEAITINANYPCYISSLNILLECNFYFDVCQIIFPELSIKLIKIKENDSLPPGVKLQHLVQILSRELQIDLSSIAGEQIIKGHLFHIHHFLQLLQKFSELHQGNGDQGEGDSSRRVKSDDPNTSDRIKQEVPRSAREKRKYRRPESENGHDESKNPKSQKEDKKNKRPYSANKRNKMKSHSTNMYRQLVGIMTNEKNMALTASMRDNRKKKTDHIVQAKNKYKSYLINHAKQERAAKNREKIANSRRKKQYRELPYDDYDAIDNHFKNFSYKLREAKYRYLKRLEKTIHAQQMDRMCYKNRIEREQKEEAELKVNQELKRIYNEHEIKNNLIKQQGNSSKEEAKLIKKQYSRYLRSQKRELKESKKNDLKKIKDLIDQENEKVLMDLEEGGRLERMIIDMYKRF